MINDDQGALNAELSKLTQASLIEAARVGDEEGVRLNGHVLYLLSTQGGSSTDTAKAETVTPLDEGKSGGGKQVSMTVEKVKAKKAKTKKRRSQFCANDKTYKVNSVKLDEIEHRSWLGVNSLLDGYEMYLHSAGISVPALVTRPQITAREVVGAFGGDTLNKSLVGIVNKALNRFEAEGMIVLRRETIVIKRKTRVDTKLNNLRYDVSVGPAGA